MMLVESSQAYEKALNALWVDTGLLGLFPSEPLQYYDLNEQDKIWVKMWLSQKLPNVKRMIEHAEVLDNRELQSILTFFRTIIAHFRIEADNEPIKVKAYPPNVRGELYDWYGNVFDELETLRRNWLKTCKKQKLDPSADENRKELYKSYDLYFIRSFYVWLTKKRNQLPLDIHQAFSETRLNDVSELSSQMATLDQLHANIVGILPKDVAQEIRDEYSEMYFPHFNEFLKDAKALLQSIEIEVENYGCGFINSKEAILIRKTYPSAEATQRIAQKKDLNPDSNEADQIRRKYPCPRASRLIQERNAAISTLSKDWSSRLNEVETSLNPDVRERVASVYRVCAEIKNFCVTVILERYADQGEDSSSPRAVRKATEEYQHSRFFKKNGSMFGELKGATRLLSDTECYDHKAPPLQTLLQVVIDQVEEYVTKSSTEKASRVQHIEQAIEIQLEATSLMKRLSASEPEETLKEEFSKFYNKLKFWYQVLDYEKYTWKRGFGLADLLFGPMRSFVLARSLMERVEMIARKDPTLAAKIELNNPPADYPYLNLVSSSSVTDEHGEIIPPAGLLKK
ncbi:MAG: hypothetical protein AB7F64_02890 [Gammaproteobacteria bacterium]